MSITSIILRVIYIYVAMLAIYRITTRGYPIDAVLDGVIVGLLIAYATIAYAMRKKGRRTP